MNKPSLNYVQAWALSYFIDMDRRVALEDKHAELEIQTYNLFPERWGALYREKALGQMTAAPGDVGQAFEGEKELPVNSIDDIRDWYDNLSTQRGISGEQVYRHQEDPMAILGIAEGEGRRV